MSSKTPLGGAIASGIGKMGPEPPWGHAQIFGFFWGKF